MATFNHGLMEAMKQQMLKDDYEMAERRLEQINAIVNQLFPE